MSVNVTCLVQTTHRGRIEVSYTLRPVVRMIYIQLTCCSGPLHPFSLVLLTGRTGRVSIELVLTICVLIAYFYKEFDSRESKLYVLLLACAKDARAGAGACLHRRQGGGDRINQDSHPQSRGIICGHDFCQLPSSPVSH